MIKLWKLLVMVMLLSVIAACERDDGPSGVAEDEETFFSHTQIEGVELDISFGSADNRNYYEEHYGFEGPEMPFYLAESHDELLAKLDGLEYATVSTENLAELEPCEGEDCRYLVLPYWAVSQRNGYCLEAGYVDGILGILFWFPEEGPHFPSTDFRMVVMRLDSPFDYDISLNPLDLEAFEWRPIEHTGEICEDRRPWW